jgi:glycosyltransferase involved in cell wall biosynthesis
MVKGVVVPRIVRGAAGLLAVGSAARASLLARGAEPDRVRLFANTIDVADWGRRVDELRAGQDKHEPRILSVARLAPEKGLATLIRAVAGLPEARLIVVGSGPERHGLEHLAAELGVSLELRGELRHDDLPELYAGADVFALQSTHEPWGVVVNEAAASGLPLVLSDQVGAAHDLLRDGENGFLVPAGDVAGTAAALRRLTDDPTLRASMGARSRELVREWGYDPSVEAFVAAVREAAASR